MSARLHLRRDRHDGEGLDMAFGLCGIPSQNVTDDPGLVRCRLCRRRMEPQAPKPTPRKRGSRGSAEPTDLTNSTSPLPFEPGPPVPVSELGGAHTITAREQRVIERVHAGDGSDVPRWRSLKAAIRKTTDIIRGRSPIRSTWKAEQESRSEGAVRTENGRDDVIEVDRAFGRTFTGPFVCGSLELTAEQARAVYEDIERNDTTAAQWAADLTDRLEVPITAHQIGKLIKNGRASMVAQLERKGLIEKRAKKVDAQEGEREMAAPHGFDLEGWKEILPLIGVSQDKARELMARKGDPLPVTQWFGKVIARKDEILAWISRQTLVRTGT